MTMDPRSGHDNPTAEAAPPEQQPEQQQPCARTLDQQPLPSKDRLAVHQSTPTTDTGAPEKSAVVLGGPSRHPDQALAQGSTSTAARASSDGPDTAKPTIGDHDQASSGPAVPPDPPQADPPSKAATDHEPPRRSFPPPVKSRGQFAVSSEQAGQGRPRRASASGALGNVAESSGAKGKGKAADTDMNDHPHAAERAGPTSSAGPRSSSHDPPPPAIQPVKIKRHSRKDMETKLKVFDTVALEVDRRIADDEQWRAEKAWLYGDGTQLVDGDARKAGHVWQYTTSRVRATDVIGNAALRVLKMLEKGVLRKRNFAAELETDALTDSLVRRSGDVAPASTFLPESPEDSTSMPPWPSAAPATVNAKEEEKDELESSDAEAEKLLVPGRSAAVQPVPDPTSLHPPSVQPRVVGSAFSRPVTAPAASSAQFAFQESLDVLSGLHLRRSADKSPVTLARSIPQPARQVQAPASHPEAQPRLRVDPVQDHPASGPTSAPAVAPGTIISGRPVRPPNPAQAQPVRRQLSQQSQYPPVQSTSSMSRPPMPSSSSAPAGSLPSTSQPALSPIVIGRDAQGRPFLADMAVNVPGHAGANIGIIPPPPQQPQRIAPQLHPASHTRSATVHASTTQPIASVFSPLDVRPGLPRGTPKGRTVSLQVPSQVRPNAPSVQAGLSRTMATPTGSQPAPAPFASTSSAHQSAPQPAAAPLTEASPIQRGMPAAFSLSDPILCYPVDLNNPAAPVEDGFLASIHPAMIPAMEPELALAFESRPLTAKLLHQLGRSELAKLYEQAGREETQYREQWASFMKRCQESRRRQIIAVQEGLQPRVPWAAVALCAPTAHQCQAAYAAAHQRLWSELPQRVLHNRFLLHQLSFRERQLLAHWSTKAWWAPGFLESPESQPLGTAMGSPPTAGLAETRQQAPLASQPLQQLPQSTPTFTDLRRGAGQEDTALRRVPSSTSTHLSTQDRALPAAAGAAEHDRLRTIDTQASTSQVPPTAVSRTLSRGENIQLQRVSSQDIPTHRAHSLSVSAPQRSRDPSVSSPETPEVVLRSMPSPQGSAAEVLQPPLPLKVPASDPPATERQSVAASVAEASTVPRKRKSHVTLAMAAEARRVLKSLESPVHVDFSPVTPEPKRPRRTWARFARPASESTAEVPKD